MTSLCTATLHETPAARHPTLRPFQALARTLLTWQSRNEHRKQLRAMPDYLLRDIGLSVDDVIEETEKPFWRP